MNKQPHKQQKNQDMKQGKNCESKERKNATQCTDGKDGRNCKG